MNIVANMLFKLGRPLWNETLQGDHTGCIRLYHNLKTPLDLFIALPVFQFHFGQASTLPCADVTKFGLVGQMI